MAVTILLEEPSAFIAGDTVKWRRSFPNYLPAEGWILTYQFGRYDQEKITVVGTDNEDQTHLITIGSTTSITFVEGEYSYQASVALGSERFTVSQGTVFVHPDIATIANADTRSHAKKVLDAIEAVIENRATREQSTIAVAGQSITLLAPEELIRWRSVYRAEVEQESRAQRIAEGHGGRRIRTRFL